VSIYKLIERLQNATGPNRLLDALINQEVDGSDPCPHYTGSMDAALTLVPEGTEWHLQTRTLDTGVREFDMEILCETDPMYADYVSMEILGDVSFHNIPAIAVCMASLTARRAVLHSKQFSLNDKVRVLPDSIAEMQGSDRRFYTDRIGTVQKLYMASAVISWPPRSRGAHVSGILPIADLERVDA
jgi:hypothetical protein